MVELMIALTLGLIVTLAAGSIFVQSKRSYVQNNQIAYLQANGRYALHVLQREIGMAGFLAEIASRNDVLIDTGVDDAIAQNCGIFTNADTTPAVPFDAPSFANGWMLRLVNGAGSNVTDTISCIGAGDYRAGTDAIIIRRTADKIETGALGSEHLYIRSNGSRAALHIGGVFSNGAIALANINPDWAYLVRAYYVQSYSRDAGDGIPTLCRETLSDVGTTPGMTRKCLVEGIENVQILLGIDDDVPGDGVPDYYTATPSDAQQDDAVSAEIHVLARSIKAVQSHTDDKTYTLGEKTVGPFNDNYYRRVFSTTVRTRNIKDPGS